MLFEVLATREAFVTALTTVWAHSEMPALHMPSQIVFRRVVLGAVWKHAAVEVVHLLHFS